MTRMTGTAATAMNFQKLLALPPIPKTTPGLVVRPKLNHPSMMVTSWNRWMCSNARCLVQRSSPAPAAATAKNRIEWRRITPELYKRTVPRTQYSGDRQTTEFFLAREILGRRSGLPEYCLGTPYGVLFLDALFLLPAGFAEAEAAVLDPLERLLDLVELVGFVLHQAQRNVLFVAVGAQVGEMLGERGEVSGGVGALLAGLVLEGLHVALEDPFARQEEGLEFLQLALGEAALDGEDLGGGGSRLHRGGFRRGFGRRLRGGLTSFRL